MENRSASCIARMPTTIATAAGEFLAGDEFDDYVNDPDNLAIYDVNTVANCDPAIIPLLDAPVGSAFSRNPSGQLVPD